jgi:uncharacterized protein
MLNQLVIDNPLEFVHDNKSLQGSVPIGDLERLHSYLANTSGELIYLVVGMLDEHGKPILKISVNGDIDLSCQRCLGKMKHVLNIKAKFILAQSEYELSRYDDDIFVEAIYAPNELNVLSLIEDEIILSLPISPRHQDIECHFPTKNQIHSTINRKHPFAVLASLKQTH